MFTAKTLSGEIVSLNVSKEDFCEAYRDTLDPVSRAYCEVKLLEEDGEYYLLTDLHDIPLIMKSDMEREKGKNYSAFQNNFSVNPHRDVGRLWIEHFPGHYEYWMENTNSLCNIEDMPVGRKCSRHCSCAERDCQRRHSDFFQLEVALMKHPDAFLALYYHRETRILESQRFNPSLERAREVYYKLNLHQFLFDDYIWTNVLENPHITPEWLEYIITNPPCYHDREMYEYVNVEPTEELWSTYNRMPQLVPFFKKFPQWIIWSELSKNPGAITILKKNRTRLSIKGICANRCYEAMQLLLSMNKKYKRIDWYILGSNPYAVDILRAELLKENTPLKPVHFASNPGMIPEIEEYLGKMDFLKESGQSIEEEFWARLCINPSAGHLVIPFLHKLPYRVRVNAYSQAYVFRR